MSVGRFHLLVFLATLFVLGSFQIIKDPAEERVLQVREQVNLQTVESLPFGVFLKKMAILDLSSTSWPHIFKIPQIPPPPVRQMKRLCEIIPSHRDLRNFITSKGVNDDEYFPVNVINQVKEAKTGFCKAFDTLTDMYGVLLNQTQSKGQHVYKNMRELTMNALPGTRKQKVNPAWRGPERVPQGSIATGLQIGSRRGSWRGKRSISTTAAPSRTERSPLDFVGEVLGGLFGLATTADVERLAGAVNKLYTNQNEMTGQFNTFKGEMLSILDVQYSRLDLFAETLNKTLYKLEIIDQRMQLARAVWYVKDFYNSMFIEILIEAIAEFSILQDATMLYFDAIQDRITALGWLNQHYLSPELVDTTDLALTFERIDPILKSDYVPFQFAFRDLTYFFSVPSTTYMSDNDFLYVQIKIPLTVLSSNYHVYEVYSVPLQASKSKIHFTKLTNLPRYVGFSKLGDTYTTFDQRFLNGCMGTRVKRCSSRIMEVSTTVPSCILGLFLQDTNMTSHYCQTDLIITPSLAEQALDIGNGRFFLSMNTEGHEFHINCAQRRPRNVAACSNCIISLGCRCNLKTTTAFISASLQNCENVTTTSGVMRTYVPNLSWIMKLQDFSKGNQDKYNMTSRFATDPTLDIPDLPLPPMAEVKDFLDRDATVTTELDQVLKQARSKEPVYISKLQEITTRTRWFFFKFHHALPMAMTSMVWLFIITVVLIILGRRQAWTVAMIRQTQLVKAASVGATIDTATYFCMWYITSLLSIYILIQVAALLYKLYGQYWTARNKNYPVHSRQAIVTDICLKLWTGVRMMQLQADTLCVPNHDLQVGPDNGVIELKVRSDVWHMKLVVDWGEIRLWHKDGLCIPLPITIKVPRYAQHLLCAILRSEDYAAALVLETGPIRMEHHLIVHTPANVGKNHSILLEHINAKSILPQLPKLYCISNQDAKEKDPPKPPPELLVSTPKCPTSETLLDESIKKATKSKNKSKRPQSLNLPQSTSPIPCKPNSHHDPIQRYQDMESQIRIPWAPKSKRKRFLSPPRPPYPPIIKQGTGPVVKPAGKQVVGFQLPINDSKSAGVTSQNVYNSDSSTPSSSDSLVQQGKHCHELGSSSKLSEID